VIEHRWTRASRVVGEQFDPLLCGICGEYAGDERVQRTAVSLRQVVK
jgi:hypothetical protein